MVSLDENLFLKYVWYFRCCLLRFQDFSSDLIQESSSVDSSSCKFLVLNLGLECVSLMEPWNCEVDHSENDHWLK